MILEIWCCNLLNRINFSQSRVSQETQTRNPKMCMKDVDHIARSIGNSSMVRVLTSQDEPCQLLLVDPVEPSYHGKAAEYPPAITDIFQLLGATV